MFRDHDGKASLSRVAIAVLIGLYVAVAAWHYAHTRVFIDVPPGIVGLIGILYGVNRGAGLLERRNGRQADT
jgi:hypothetical protein